MVNTESKLSLLLRRYHPSQLTFFFLFFLYLLLLSFSGALALHFLQEGAPRPFVDTLFLSASVTTTTGLLTVDISTLTGGAQAVLFVMMVLGSPLLCSAFYPFAKWLYVRRALVSLAARAAAEGKPATELANAHVIAVRELVRDSLFFAMALIGGLFLAFYAAGLAFFLSYCAAHADTAALLAARGVRPMWFAAFHAMSTTNNVGISLLTDSMAPFKGSTFMLLVTALLSVATGVAVPLLLRCAIWLLARAFPRDARFKFLLRHPRVVFYNVFPYGVTLQMFIWLVLFTAYQTVSTIATDWNSGFWGDLGGAERALLAFFKAVMTRTTGFVATNVVDFSSADSFLLAIFMYVAAFPFLIAQRETKNSRHYEERASSARVLGVSALFDAEGAEVDTVEQRLKEILATAKAEEPSPLTAVATGPAPLMLTAILLILYADNSKTYCMSEAFSVFGVIFEVASAFGNVGLSLSTDALSTVAFLSVFSKVVVMAVMFFGRMRIVPERSELMDVSLYEQWGEPILTGDSPVQLSLLEGGGSLSGHLYTIGQGVLALQQTRKRSLVRLFSEGSPGAKPPPAKAAGAGAGGRSPPESAPDGATGAPSTGVFGVFGVGVANE
jgi:Trk-type K+ transport system membrane component